MKALILASGEGKRLRPYTEKIPKTLLPLPWPDGKPVLEHIVESLVCHGITNIVMAVGVMREQIKNYFGNCRAFLDGSDQPQTVFFEYAESDRPEGTAGEIAKSQHLLGTEEDFILHYGDTLTNVDFTRLIRTHKDSRAIVTGPAMPEIPTECGVYVCSPDGTVRSFHEKPFINDLVEMPGLFSNVPVYVVSPDIWDAERFPAMVQGKDFNADVVPSVVAEKGFKVFRQKGLRHLDIGDPKKYETISQAYRDGTQERLRKLG